MRQLERQKRQYEGGIGLADGLSKGGRKGQILDYDISSDSSSLRHRFTLVSTPILSLILALS